jgi:predicted phage terminase large subunit-like protein
LDILKKELGSRGYTAQIQQRPIPADGGMLKPHSWQYWQPRGANLPPVPVRMPDGTIEMRKAVELPDNFDLQSQSWDMSFKDTKNADFVVGLVLAALGANRYVLDLKRDRLDFPGTLAAVRRLSARWPLAQQKLVEDRANGPAVIQMLRQEIGGFIAVNPEGGKVCRAAAASPLLESGNWYLPHPNLFPWVAEFIGECSAFPGGAHDDQVDAWSQGANHMLYIRPKPSKPPFFPPYRPGGDRSWMV